VVALGHFQDRLDPRPRTPGADPLQALMDQDAVVGIQRHHVGHAAQGHQVEQLADIGLRLLVVPAQAAQARAQGHQHVENHPDARQGLAGEPATGLVRVDDGIGCRQFIAGQVVVGDQHLEARRLRRRHTLDTGDAVVHGNQQVRLALQGHGDDFRGQAVAVFEAVGHQVIHMGRPEQAQAEGAHGAGGGAIGVEVADDQDALALLQGRHQQIHGSLNPFELLIGNQPRQAFIQLILRGHATGGVETGQQRWQFTEERQDSRQWAGIDAHGVMGASVQYNG
jgi:hypothetical protein